LIFAFVGLLFLLPTIAGNGQFMTEFARFGNENFERSA
jgi:hypothetical protein